MQLLRPFSATECSRRGGQAEQEAMQKCGAEAAHDEECSRREEILHMGEVEDGGEGPHQNLNSGRRRMKGLNSSEPLEGREGPSTSGST